MRILLVEDDPILGEGIAIGLRQTKATVDWFRSAEDAMAALATESFSAVVQVLVEHLGTVLSRQRIEQALYASGEEVESNTVEVHIHHLRKKLGSELIRTARGVGYAIDAER